MVFKVEQKMVVQCNNLYSTNVTNTNMFANLVATSNLSNISVTSDLRVNGDIFTSGRMDVGTTIFATFRLTSNLSFAQSSEVYALSNSFVLDWTHTNMHGMSDMTMAVPPYQVYNQSTGTITVPVDGLYTLSMQGVFQNDSNAVKPKNGVYYTFQNHTYPTARTAARISLDDEVVSTSHTAFLLGGDKFRPTFYSNDSNAILRASNGETYVSFALLATMTPSLSNFVRLP